MQSKWFTARANNGVAEVQIYDEIGAYGTHAKEFGEQLKALGPVNTINLAINSPGGEVFDGLAIHNMLRRHKANVVVTIDGIAASIASVIAMAGDEIVMPGNAMMMIHDPSGVVMGTSKDMRELADALDKIKAGLIRAYAQKSGLDDDRIAELMAAETWLTAAEAQELGFADTVTDEQQIAARWDFSKFTNVPSALLLTVNGAASAPVSLQPADAKETQLPISNAGRPTDDQVARVEKFLAKAKKEDAEALAALLAFAKAKAETTEDDPDEEKPEEMTAENTETEDDEDEKTEANKAKAKSSAADAVKAERKRAADIMAVCQLSNAEPKAAAFIADGKSVSEVVAELAAARAAPEPLSTRRPIAHQPANDGWGSIMDKINARIG